MSGTSDISTCPACGGRNLQVYTDWKPFNYSQCECFDCGFYCYPKTDVSELKELNERRSDNEMKPLTKKQYAKNVKLAKKFIKEW